jgi:hypothetical protein
LLGHPRLADVGVKPSSQQSRRAHDNVMRTVSGG